MLRVRRSKLVEHHFPHAVQIVDWYHASEYLPPVAEAAFSLGTPHYHAWLENARTLLWEGQIVKLIQACQHLSSQAASPVHKAITYFIQNQHRMDYAHFHQQGYFIGSGTVESSSKQIAGLRLKRAGARWTEDGALTTAQRSGCLAQWHLGCFGCQIFGPTLAGSHPLTAPFTFDLYLSFMRASIQLRMCGRMDVSIR